MKKYILLFVLVIVAVAASCDNDNARNDNKYLPNYSFSIPIDMDLPLYTPLKSLNNPVRIDIAGAGINGIIVIKAGSGYMAFEASCPNQPLTTCSVLTMKKGDIVATCPCDGVKYNLLTGLADASANVQYGLKQYRVQQTSSTTITVSN